MSSSNLVPGAIGIEEVLNITVGEVEYLLILHQEVVISLKTEIIS